MLISVTMKLKIFFVSNQSEISFISKLRNFKTNTVHDICVIDGGYKKIINNNFKLLFQNMRVYLLIITFICQLKNKK